MGSRLPPALFLRVRRRVDRRAARARGDLRAGRGRHALGRARHPARRALYAAPLLVWVRFSRDVVSPAGLAGFVEAAAGRRLALVQAAVWAFSYFLYLPYTVTDIVYEMLAVVFPGIEPWRPVLELVIPIAIVALVLLGTVPALRVLAVSAVVAARDPRRPRRGRHPSRRRAGRVVHARTRPPPRRGEHRAPLRLRQPAALPGRRGRRREPHDPPRASDRGLVAAAYVLFAVFAFAAVDPALRSADFPGYAIAGAYSGRTLAIVVGVGAAASVAGLIVAEYLALSRLLFAFTGVPICRLVRLIAVPFVALDALSLIDPEWFDEHVLRPSLIALYLSQLIVFAVYPLYRRRPVDVALAAIAFGLMAWGLWRGITAPVST